VQRSSIKSPQELRRAKLLAAIAEQLKVAAAATAGTTYTVKEQRWRRNAAGERVLMEVSRRVRAWFFKQDGGVYVQCKYGARSLPISERGNAVFVREVGDVAAVLEAFSAACTAGEFDAALQNAAVRNAT